MNNIIIVGDLFPTEQNLHLFSSGDIKSLFGIAESLLSFVIVSLKMTKVKHLPSMTMTFLI